MKATAWIVAIIEPRAFVNANGGRMSLVLGADVFSEPHPTTTTGQVTVPLESFEADTYTEAVRMAWNALARDCYEWCGTLRDDAIRGRYRDART
jgi:hypothetical protein